MITIPKISFLNRGPIGNIKQSEAVNANAQNKPAHIYIYDSLKNNNFVSNLAPLEKDTISFGNAAPRKGDSKLTKAQKDAKIGKVRKATKQRTSKKLDPAYRSSQHLASIIREDVDFAYRRLRTDVNSIFNMNVLETDDPQFNVRYETELMQNIADQKLVLAITSRKKSVKSIAEKMGHMKLSTKNDALENLHDIVGVRILVSNSDRKSGEYVADRLLKAVKDGWIKISEIEIYRNPELYPDDKYDYIREKRLDEIATEAKKKAKEFKYVTRKTDFGYTAVHFGVDLPGGIKGEIQVMSPKIAAFKDIEDICYKGLSGKGLPTGYGRLKPAFDKIDPEVDREAYDEFAAYTRQAYAHERKKRSKDRESAFLSIPDGSRIPPRLDFNNIAKMRQAIENSRREKEAQKMREEAVKLIDNIMAD